MSASSQNTSCSTMPETKSYRLPRKALPKHYDLTFEPDFQSLTFTGAATIDLEVVAPTDKIVLNAKELEVFKSVATNNDGAKLNGTVTLDDEYEFAEISFPETLSIGDWKLEITFKGIHNDKLKGFYRSNWTAEDGKKHTLVCTQFESTDARRAFPCFDEPDLKATYTVSMVVSKDFAAISNGRITEEKVDAAKNKKTVRFRKTMKMSTYLLAMIVGDLIPSKIVVANGIDLCAWTIPGKTHLTDFALKVAAFTINYFEEYFRVKYPDADKCDLIALPDFASGAMENKDCITFRETALLVDEKIASHAELERVAEVVMHELAHMWFGDLVTMRWWNGLWLNEAFATFMEVKALDAFRKDWRVWDTFGISRAAASRTDSLKSTHPIESPVERPEEAQELFDVISYRKGCAVLYQIEQFIGEEIFRNGITHYLNKHAYGNTETYDLWDSLELACREAGSDIPVRKIMDDWVFTAGHPLVSVKEGTAPNSIIVSQQQFKFLPEAAQAQPYLVPITMAVKTNSGKVEIQKFVLSEKEKTVSLNSPFQLVVLNAGGSGFYRVRYDSNLLQKLASNPKENLSIIERFNLVNDTWATVRAGLTSASDYLKLIKGFANEDDVNVWSIISSSMHALNLLLPENERGVCQKFIKDLFGPQAEKLGWEPKAPNENESVQTKQLRGLLHGALGTIGGDKAVAEKAATYFEKWKKDKTSIDANILPAIVNMLAYHGNKERYEEFRQISKTAKTPQEVIRFLYSLAAFRDLSLLKQTIASCLSDDVRTQDAPYLLASVTHNEIGNEAGWQFIKENWERMLEAYPENSMPRMCESILPSLDRPKLEADAKEFFAKHKVPTGDMAVAQGLELLRVNVLMREREAKNLKF